jgi:uncharacterized membrane-anchored protein
VAKKGLDMPHASTSAKELAPKVPQITLLFWIVKVLTTGMGESMSDFMGQKSVPIAGLVGVLGFALAMRTQLRAKAYSAPVYWLAVMMVAVFGTMVADGIKDGLGLSYAVTTPVFALAVTAVFVLWRRREGTLSIHSITSRRRERFYWAAVLGTFALGTAAGDLTAMTLRIGYFGSIVLFGCLIALPALAWARGRLNPIAAFWLAYILTRPLGASIADWLAKPDNGGLGWGDGAVSGLALVAFAGLVAYLTASGRGAQRRPVALRPRLAED